MGTPLDIAREEVGRYLCCARGSSFSVWNTLILGFGKLYGV
jgi:hypothetical protein